MARTEIPGRYRGDESRMTRVLYVDADGEMGGLVRHTFEEAGAISVCLAGSAEEALASLSRICTDVIVSDYRLHGMNGVDLLKSLRGQGIYAPFIFFTHDFVVPLREVACLPDVFRFNGRNGYERKEILRLLRIVYWVTGNPEAGAMPVATVGSTRKNA